MIKVSLRKKFTKTICLALSVIYLLLGTCVLVSCNLGEEEEKGSPNLSYSEYSKVDYEPNHTSDSRILTYVSSETGLDDFLNEYRERHMRYNDNQIHSYPVGAGSTAWKEWEAMIGSWWDASAANGTLSSTYATKDLVTDWLLNPKQDNQGYVWTDDGDTLSSWAMGWEFPNAVDTGGTVFDFSEGYNDFTLYGDGATGGIIDSKFHINLQEASYVEFISPVFEQSAIIAPFLQMNFSLSITAGALDDVYIYYTTEESNSWSEDKKVSFSDDCTTGYQIENTVEGGFFFPMYLQDEWGESRTNWITRIKVVYIAEESVTGDIDISYIATDYDDRLALNVCNYILAAKSVLEYAQDSSLLEYLLPFARKAINFLYYQLNGESGLVSTEYFVGHDNTGLHLSGTGLGDGYWDVLSFPDVNMYVNLSWYNSICAMEYLENMALDRGISIDAVTTVNAEMDGTDTYCLTADKLASLRVECAEQFRSEFWNEKTGRFHAGKISGTTIQDHGYLMFNEQAIALGLATDEQTDSILEWINGERTVSGDSSIGSDIYYYEFAPRFNTAEIGSDFYWGYSASFGGNVQNGGTALHLAYYDLVAQSAEGADQAYGRLQTIQAWYEKVKAAGGTGWNFYRAYYDNTTIALQGGSSSGVIGLDYEFLEAALLLKAIPDVFFGLSAEYDNTLVLQPSMPSNVDWWTMENITFSGYYCDLTASQYFVQVSSVEEMYDGSAQSGANIRLILPEPSFDYEVYIDGAATTDFIVEDGLIIYVCNFGNVRLEITDK